MDGLTLMLEETNTTMEPGVFGFIMIERARKQGSQEIGDGRFCKMVGCGKRDYAAFLKENKRCLGT